MATAGTRGDCHSGACGNASTGVWVLSILRTRRRVKRTARQKTRRVGITCFAHTQIVWTDSLDTTQNVWPEPLMATRVGVTGTHFVVVSILFIFFPINPSSTCYI